MINNKIYTFNFYKTKEKRWFINLPEWTGDPEALELILGADSLLNSLDTDYLGNVNVKFTEDLQQMRDCDGILILNKNIDPGELGGGIYEYGKDGIETVYLCDVTKFIFNGRMPGIIYFKKI